MIKRIPTLLLLIACTQARNVHHQRQLRSRHLQDDEEPSWSVPVPTASPTSTGSGDIADSEEADPTGGVDENTEQFDEEDPNAPAEITTAATVAEGEGAPSEMAANTTASVMAASNATVNTETVDLDANESTESESSEPQTIDLDANATAPSDVGFSAANTTESTGPSEEEHAETIDLDANQDTSNTTQSTRPADEGDGIDQSTRPVEGGFDATNTSLSTTEATRPAEGESPTTPSPKGKGDDWFEEEPTDDQNETDDYDWEGESESWAKVPTPKPSPRPTYEYISSTDDMLVKNEIDPTSFDDALTVQGKVQNYLEGVESAEEMEKDVNVQVVAGALTGVFLVLWLITAWQTMENPDGLCAR
jgi:hypothetical protein